MKKENIDGRTVRGTPECEELATLQCRIEDTVEENEKETKRNHDILEDSKKSNLAQKSANSMQQAKSTACFCKVYLLKMVFTLMHVGGKKHIFCMRKLMN